MNDLVNAGAAGLEVRGLSAGYGGGLVLDALSFDLAPGDSLAVLGRNGVGKTTLLRSLMGLTRIAAGQIRWRGEDLRFQPVDARARRGIAWVPQERGIWPSLSVHEHLQAVARPGPWTVTRVLELFPRLAERRALPGGRLSGGEQQMLAIARALVLNPALLLLDEPMEGLAPRVVEDLAGVLRDLIGQDGQAVVIVEQHARLALGMTRQVLVLDRGRVVHTGPSVDLLREPARIESYLTFD